MFCGTTTFFVAWCGPQVSLECYRKHALFDRNPPSHFPTFLYRFCKYQAEGDSKTDGWHIKVGVRREQHQWCHNTVKLMDFSRRNQIGCRVRYQGCRERRDWRHMMMMRYIVSFITYLWMIWGWGVGGLHSMPWYWVLPNITFSSAIIIWHIGLHLQRIPVLKLLHVWYFKNIYKGQHIWETWRIFRST